MSRRTAMALVALLALMAQSRSARAQLLSPGDLTRPHSHLEGDDSCDKCHSSGRRVAETKCLDCHDALQRRVRAKAGLHGKTYRGQKCVKCHVEHIGRSGRLVRWPGGDMKRFQHRLAGWRLGGKHRKVRCLECHDQKTPRGGRTFLGLSRSCDSCHNDPHAGRLGTSCTSCHSESSWKQVTLESFDHNKARFPLRGEHRQVDCEGCHGKPAVYGGLSFSTCDACHEDPHRGQFKPRTCDSCHTESGWHEVGEFRRNHPGLSLANGHRRVSCKRCHDRGNLRAPSRGSRCVGCHRPVHKAKFGKACGRCHGSIRWLGLPERLGRRVHRKTRYPLEGKHRRVDCERCHPKSKPRRARFRGISFERCDGCHADRHDGAFASRDDGECAACHTIGGFLPTTFGIELHATTSFALEGRHQAVPCRGCHGSKRPRLNFRVSEKTCGECHDNPHGDQFAAEMSKGGCAHCHTTSGWKNPKIDHSTWPLTGAHAHAECAACHRVPDSERLAGRGPAYRGVPRTCEGCHEDVHAGQFRLEEPVKSCERCHDTHQFAIDEFDHEQLGGWKLEGKHVSVACASCHPSVQLKNGQSAIRYRLGYRACKDCHANPHRE